MFFCIYLLNFEKIKIIRIIKMNIFQTLKTIIFGKNKNPLDSNAFHNLTLIAFYAWVGLGSDGLSSSCYGPSEIMYALGQHSYLSFIIGIATVLTIFIISSSYTQIIELFPTGGGGYLVASKLLSPNVGMISGSALLIDYVLTISVSIASGTDALFSFIPTQYQSYKVLFSILILIILITLNIRGVKESVITLLPVFLFFVITHLFIIVYGLFMQTSNLPAITTKTYSDIGRTYTELGTFGFIFLIMHAYSMGAGSYTGIEAVSNGLPILREPKVHTAKKVMLLMSFSLSFFVFGLLTLYLLYNVKFVTGQTLNASLFNLVTSSWSPTVASIFVIFTLISEGAILYIAAQTGFIDGPRVLSNMALDRWAPTKFASLSDRLVTQNGVLLMGISAFLLIWLTDNNVTYLIVLYSINVFLTFSLSQVGMVRHWLKVRNKEKKILRKITINAIGAALTILILVSVIIVKFHEGGWITLVITSGVASLAFLIHKHYKKTGDIIKEFDAKLLDLNQSALEFQEDEYALKAIKYDKNGKTAVLFVNGFSGIGIHSLLSSMRLFDNTFKNYVFVEIGMIDAGVFKGTDEIIALKNKVDSDIQQYVSFVNHLGFYAEGFISIGLDIVQETLKLVPEIIERFPNSIFFGGQIVFKKETFFTRQLHNHTVFSIQKELYHQGYQFVILPIKL